jgi:hypothetical protein
VTRFAKSALWVGLAIVLWVWIGGSFVGGFIDGWNGAARKHAPAVTVPAAANPARIEQAEDGSWTYQDPAGTGCDLDAVDAAGYCEGTFYDEGGK